MIVKSFLSIFLVILLLPLGLSLTILVDWGDVKRMGNVNNFLESPLSSTDCLLSPVGGSGWASCSAFFVVNSQLAVSSPKFDWARNNTKELTWTRYANSFLENVTTCRNHTVFDYPSHSHWREVRCETKTYRVFENETTAAFPLSTGTNYLRASFQRLNWEQSEFNLTAAGIKLDPQHMCGTISSAGLYLLNQSIAGDTNCILIEAADVILDCDHFTIGHSNSGAGFGVKAWNLDNITVRNCNVVETSTGLEGASGISLVGATNSRVENCRVESKVGDNEAHTTVDTSYGTDTVVQNITSIAGEFYSEGGSGLILDNSTLSARGYGNQVVYLLAETNPSILRSSLTVTYGRIGEAQGGGIFSEIDGSGHVYDWLNITLTAGESSAIALLDGFSGTIINNTRIIMESGDSASGIRLNAVSPIVENTVIEKKGTGSSGYEIVGSFSGASFLNVNASITSTESLDFQTILLGGGSFGGSAENNWFNNSIFFNNAGGNAVYSTASSNNQFVNSLISTSSATDYAIVLTGNASGVSFINSTITGTKSFSFAGDITGANCTNTTANYSSATWAAGEKGNLTVWWYTRANVTDECGAKLTNYTCIQQLANESTGCGLATGTYNFFGMGNIVSASQAVDNVYTTFAHLDQAIIANFTANYSKPSGATNFTWGIAMGNGEFKINNATNFTVTPECFAQDPIRMMSNNTGAGDQYIHCWAGTYWKKLGGGTPYGNRVYDEAGYLTINYSVSVNITQNNTRPVWAGNTDTNGLTPWALFQEFWQNASLKTSFLPLWFNATNGAYSNQTYINQTNSATQNIQLALGVCSAAEALYKKLFEKLQPLFFQIHQSDSSAGINWLWLILFILTALAAYALYSLDRKNK